MMNSQTILLVEDNPDDEVLTVEALTFGGITNDIVVVHDGIECLEYLFGEGEYAGRDTSELPAVVLLDLNMPRLGGLELLTRLRADPRTQRLPVVILTTSKDESDMVASYDRGANSFVRKPVDFEAFTEAARNLGMYWLLLNQRPSR
ncbi:MAG: response regulator [Rhodocyclaceae bacterium]|nr:response regulator [Rhodocyclaceae bacterium]